MIKISAETFAKSCAHNILDKEKKLWLRNKNIGKKLEVENIYNLIDKEIKDKFETTNPTKQQIREYKRHGSELFDDENFMYTHEGIIMSIIMNCSVSTPKATEFRAELGLKQHDMVLTKEQSMVLKITKLFSNEKVLLQYRVLGYKIDLYFPKHKLAIEVDEKGHADIDEKRKIKERKK